MAKYRTTDAAAGQGLFLTVNLQDQLLPDSFEYMLNEILGTKHIERHERKDDEGTSDAFILLEGS